MANDQKQQLDLEGVLPFLMLAAPFVEKSSPGSGLGLIQGVTQYQQQRAVKRRQDMMSLATLFSEADPSQHETIKGALRDQGWDRAAIEAGAKLGSAFTDPTLKAKRFAAELIPFNILGVQGEAPRGQVQEMQLGEAQRQQAVTTEEQQFQRGQVTEEQRFQRGQAAQLAGEARQQLLAIALDPRTTPKAQGRARVLLQQLQQGVDPQTVIAEIPTLAGQLLPAGKPPLEPNQIVALHSKAWDDAAKLVLGGRADPLAVGLAIAGGADPAQLLAQGGATPAQIAQIEDRATALAGQRLRAAGYKPDPEIAKAVRMAKSRGIPWTDVAEALQRDGLIPELYYAIHKSAEYKVVDPGPRPGGR